MFKKKEERKQVQDLLFNRMDLKMVNRIYHIINLMDLYNLSCMTMFI